MLKKCLIIIGLLLPLAINAHSYTPQLGKNNGLETENISALMFDNLGFMWIGSKDGLFIYDGYRLTQFMPDQQDAKAISARDIRQIYQSKKNNTIWVSTNSGGLNQYLPQSNAFKAYRHESNNSNSLSDDSVYDVVEDENGLLWIATQSGLNRLNPQTGSISRFNAGGSSGLLSDYIYTVFIDNNQTLWIGTLGGGLAYWDAAEQKAIHLALPSNLHDDVFSLAQELDRFLWVGTRHGLLKVDLYNKAVKQVFLRTKPLQEPSVISLRMSQSGNLLIGTIGSGLLVFDTKTETLLHDTKQDALNIDTVTSIAESEHGDVFFSTWGAGIHRLDNTANAVLSNSDSFFTFHHITSVSAVLDAPRHNRTWLGSLGDGLYWLDHGEKKLNKVDSSNLSADVSDIYSIAQTPNGQLFVGTTNGLWQLNANADTIALYQHNPQNPTSIGKGYVRVVQPDADGSIWIGTGGDGVFQFDTKSQKFTQFHHQAGTDHSLSGNYITALLVEDHYIWVGTRSDGLNQCDKKKWHCRRFEANTTSELSLKHFYITDIVKDADGNIWIGTDSGGLHQVIKNTADEVIGFKTTENTQSIGASVKSILAEVDGSLWISTEQGLTIYDPKDDSLKRLSDKYFRQTGTFSQSAKASSNRTNFFGTHNGVIAISRHTDLPHATVPPVRITRIQHSSQPEPIANAAITEINKLTVPWGGMLSIEFAILDFTESRHDYQYRMSSDTEWTLLEGQNQINFFKLEPGQFPLQIRGKSNNGFWSQPTNFQINVIPPWWLNTHYRIFAGFVLLFILVTYHRFRIAKWRKYSDKLNKLQQQKHAALEELKVREEKLEHAYQGMRNLASKIQNAKEEERKAISRELHDQFGQTLTAAQINLQLYEKNGFCEHAKIVDTITNIKAMIKQVRALSFNLRPPVLDDVGFIAAIESLIAEMSTQEQRITLVGQENFPALEQSMTTALFRIIQETLSNAIRHAHASQIMIILDHSAKQVSAEITDNGIGFDLKAVKSKAAKGLHLGLLGVEERVLLQNGKLNIKSKPGLGTTVKVEFKLESQ